MFFNVDVSLLSTVAGEIVKQSLTESGEQDFKYLGSWSEQDRDINTRKALAWKALNQMDKIWKSELLDALKLRFFRATVEAILLYGSATWSLSKSEEKRLDGCYTRMLKKVYNIKGITKISNERLYKGLSPVSDIIKARRLRLAGHTFRDQTSPAHLTVTWDPSHGTLSRGRPAHTLIDTLLRDTGLDNIRELECCMSEKNEWRNRVSRCQTSG